VRYADDFVVLARVISDPILGFIHELLEGKMELKLSEHKTRIVNLNDPGSSLDFLGYTFRFVRGRWKKRYLSLVPSKKALAKRREQVKYLTRRRNRASLPEVIAVLNKTLPPWGRYFSQGYPYEAFSQMDNYVRSRLIRYAARRSQRPMRAPKGMTHYAWFQSLGLKRLTKFRSQPQTNR